MDNEPLPHAQDGGDEPDQGHEPRSGSSLADDLVALLDDGKTYLEAEKAYQKSRAIYVAHKGKKGIVHALIAFALIHLALIGLVVGAVMALAPVLTTWGATALVTGVLLIAGAVLGRKALAHFQDAGNSFTDDRP